MSTDINQAVTLETEPREPKRVDGGDSLSFKTDIKGLEKSTYSFELEDDNELPKKLGDGTYGVVFAIRKAGSPNKKYAVKLFYDLGDEASSEQKRQFNAEIEASQKINEKIEDANEVSNVVTAESGTEHFKSSAAWEKFKEYFTHLRVSDYALVMERFDRTLKQLLEDRRFTLQESNELVNKVFPKGAPLRYSEQELELEIQKKNQGKYSDVY